MIIVLAIVLMCELFGSVLFVKRCYVVYVRYLGILF